MSDKFEKIWAVWDVENSEFVDSDVYKSEAKALEAAKELALENESDEGYIVLEATLRVTAPKNVIVEDLRDELLLLTNDIPTEPIREGETK